MKKLATAKTTNGSTDILDTTGSDLTGRPLAIHIFGTFDGASVQVYMSLNGVTNGAPIPELLTADAEQTAGTNFKIIWVPAGVTLWAVVSAAGAGTTLNIWVAGEGSE